MIEREKSEALAPDPEKSGVKSDSTSSRGIKSWNDNKGARERMEEYYGQIL